MCIRRKTREKARKSLAFSPVSKPHTHRNNFVYVFENNIPDVLRCGRSLHLYVLFITDQYKKKYSAGYIGRNTMLCFMWAIYDYFLMIHSIHLPDMTMSSDTKIKLKLRKILTFWLILIQLKNRYLSCNFKS
jgi:hypothetical protein